MPTLPPELDAFASILDAHLGLRPKCGQPAPVREAFQYCLCLLMVEAGKMRLVEKRSSEPAPGLTARAGWRAGQGTGVCVFETGVRDIRAIYAGR